MRGFRCCVVTMRVTHRHFNFYTIAAPTQKMSQIRKSLHSYCLQFINPTKDSVVVFVQYFYFDKYGRQTSKLTIINSIWMMLNAVLTVNTFRKIR